MIVVPNNSIWQEWGGGRPISESKIMRERRVERNTTCYSHLPPAPSSSLLSVRRCDIRAIRQGPGGQGERRGWRAGAWVLLLFTLYYQPIKWVVPWSLDLLVN